MSRALELETASAAPASPTQEPQPGSGSSPVATSVTTSPVPMPAGVIASQPMPMPMPMPIEGAPAATTHGNTTQQSPELVQHAVVNIQSSGLSASASTTAEGTNGGKSPIPTAAAAGTRGTHDQQAPDADVDAHAHAAREKQLAAQALKQKEIDALQAHRAAIAGERTYVACDGCFAIVLPFHALYVFAKRSLVRYNYFVYSPVLWLYLLFIFVALVLDVVIRISFTILFAVMSCLGSTYRGMSDHLATTVYTGYGYTKEEAKRDAQQQRESDQGCLACIACIVYVLLIWYYYMFCVFAQLAMALAFGMVILLFSAFLELHVAVVKYRATGYYEDHVIEKLRAIIAKNQINEAD